MHSPPRGPAPHQLPPCLWSAGTKAAAAGTEAAAAGTDPALAGATVAPASQEAAARMMMWQVYQPPEGIAELITGCLVYSSLQTHFAAWGTAGSPPVLNVTVEAHGEIRLHAHLGRAWLEGYVMCNWGNYMALSKQALHHCIASG